MFVHHVFFFLKNPDSAADRDQLVAGLQTLTELEGVKLAHIGKVADTHRGVIDRSYSVSWLMLFDTKAEQDGYQDHPIHHKFVENCAHLWEKVIVYDSDDI